MCSKRISTNATTPLLPSVTVSNDDLHRNLGDIAACGLLAFVDVPASVSGKRSLGNWAGDQLGLARARAELGLDGP